MPTGVLFGQIAVVLAVALAGVWAATQWTAGQLGFQARLGPDCAVQIASHDRAVARVAPWTVIARVRRESDAPAD